MYRFRLTCPPRPIDRPGAPACELELRLPTDRPDEDGELSVTGPDNQVQEFLRKLKMSYGFRARPMDTTTSFRDLDCALKSDALLKPYTAVRLA